MRQFSWSGKVVPPPREAAPRPGDRMPGCAAGPVCGNYGLVLMV